MVKKGVNKILERFGYRLVKQPTQLLPPDMDEAFRPLYLQCRDYTMTSRERMYALYKAVEYVVRGRVQGDFVECGVWRGGSAMLAALAFQAFHDADRRFYLYDTFQGMTEPTEKDATVAENYPAKKLLEEIHAQQDYENIYFARASLEEVRHNMASTGYANEKLNYVQGDVTQTIPETIPDRIALLRLDTDWHASTYHEIKHLFPRLSQGGVLIIDDYGYWRGAKEAVDQYLAEEEIPILLVRVDDTGRVAIKA